MIQENTKETETIRVPVEIMSKIRKIAKENGQTYTGYISLALLTSVNKDYNKLIRKQSKHENKLSGNNRIQ